MKILCYLNHYFGINNEFIGKSSLKPGISQKEFSKRAQQRKVIVENAIIQIRKLKFDITLKVCGIHNCSLVPLDKEFNHCSKKTLHLIYEILRSMESEINKYDYFINMEDDIYIPEETLDNIIKFDKVSHINEILLPNRLEKSKTGNLYCVDLLAMPGWTQQRKSYNNKILRVAFTPHSALLIMRRDKFKYSLSNIDKTFRGKIFGIELASAFAHFHSPFSLFRSEDFSYNYVIHLDNWSFRKESSSIRTIDFIPPIIFRITKFFRKRNL